MSENATCDAKTDCNDGSDETYTHARCGGKIQTKGCSHMPKFSLPLLSLK